MRKRIILIILCILLCCVAGCSNRDTDPEDTIEDNNIETTEIIDDTPSVTPDEVVNKRPERRLFVGQQGKYFSWKDRIYGKYAYLGVVLRSDGTITIGEYQTDCAYLIGEYQLDHDNVYSFYGDQKGWFGDNPEITVDLSDKTIVGYFVLEDNRIKLLDKKMKPYYQNDEDNYLTEDIVK